jgi:hypothetical protein
LYEKGPTLATGTGILMYGKDEQLLDTRRLVLERSGYRVIVGTTLSEVRDLGANGIGLLIFCHTVSAEESERVTALAQERWPGTRKLFMSVGELGGPMTSSDDVVSATDGPEMMIAAVGRVVGTKGVGTHMLCSRVNEGGPDGTIRRDSEVV